MNLLLNDERTVRSPQLCA